MEQRSSRNIECPTIQDAYAIYSDTMGTERAHQIVDEALQHCQVKRDTSEIAELSKVFEYLSGRAGLIGVYGMSLRVRLMTYHNIRRMQDRE